AVAMDDDFALAIPRPGVVANDYGHDDERDSRTRSGSHDRCPSAALEFTGRPGRDDPPRFSTRSRGTAKRSLAPEICVDARRSDSGQCSDGDLIVSASVAGFATVEIRAHRLGGQSRS